MAGWNSPLGIKESFGGTGVFEYEPISEHYLKTLKFENNVDWVTPTSYSPPPFSAEARLPGEFGDLSNLSLDPLLDGNRTDIFSGQLGSQVFAYPVDIDIEQDHLEIDEMKYSRPGTGAGDSENPVRGSAQNAAGPGASVASYIIGSTIILPMPKAADASGAEWGKNEITGDEMNRSSQSAGYKGIFRRQGKRNRERREQNEATYGTSQMDTSGFDSKNPVRSGAQDSGARVRGGQRNWINYAMSREWILRGKTAAKNLGTNVTASSLLARERGQVLNPNAELLFQGPSLRSFEFTWLMVARSPDEGKSIRKIIKRFKQGAAPKWNNTALLETPSIWQLSYKRGREPLKTANKFRQCALVSITVDYAPDGIWSSYEEDSQPVAVRMGLSFKELRAIYQSDQLEGDEKGQMDSVGY